MANTAADAYAKQIDATDAQRAGRRGGQPEADRWGASAQRFRLDPRGELDDTLSAIAAYVEPDDVLLDVGGGAGRLSLPLASRCREIVNVEPSTGMGAEFEASAREAGIANARWLQSPWPAAVDVAGDVSLVANVTYFVRDIVPFVQKLSAASRRRVIVVVFSMPQPNQGSDVYEVVYGRKQAPVPGHRELLPVLWDLGILPDVRVLGSANAGSSGRGPASMGLSRPVFATRDEAIESALTDRQLDDAALRAARGRLEAAFDALFAPDAGGFQRRVTREPRVILITWPTRPQ